MAAASDSFMPGSSRPRTCSIASAAISLAIRRRASSCSVLIARARASSGASRGRRTSDVVLFGALARAVVVDHHPDELREPDRRLPAELLSRLRVVAHEQVDLGRTEVPLVDLHVLAPVETGVAERLLEELAYRMRLAGGEDVVV